MGWQVNYCQGMNFLAALLLTWLPTQEAAFGALVVLMHGRGLRELYKSDLQALQVCWQHAVNRVAAPCCAVLC